MNYGTRQQLAAYMVEGQDSFPGPSLFISMSGGKPSIGLQDGAALVWLASTREPGFMRQFATLDAAWRECLEIAALAGVDGTPSVRLSM